MGRRRGNDAEAGAFLSLLEQRAPRPLSIDEMARALKRERFNVKTLRTALDAEVARHRLRRVGKKRYQWVREHQAPRRPPGRRQQPAGHERAERPRRARAGATRVEGHYDRVRAGYGFVEVLGRAAEAFTRDILIPAGAEGPALHGDRVEVEIVRRDPRSHRVVGRVVRVTGAVHERIIGTVVRLDHGWCLRPENQHLPVVRLVGATVPRPEHAGLVGLARLSMQAPSPDGPAGELVTVLGAADDPEVQFLCIAYEHGLRIEYPAEVLAEAALLPVDPSATEFAGRRDLRALPFVTIDGETARDFDDAVHLEPHGRGGYRLWVAIADVAHYVRPGTTLDAEAARRGTSVYFPDRAIPMLPPRLSNELCSLNPARDRLVLVAEITLDAGGKRRELNVYRAVIRSHARLTYTQVAAVLSDADTAEIRAWRNDLAPLLPQLHHMQALMRVLYRNRVAAGSLDLDLPEALIDLSEAGRSVGVRLLQRNDAHRIIEELMLEANRAVASFLTDREVPLPYRIHEPPDPDDIEELNQFLQPFGFHCRYRSRVAPQDVQRVLTQIEGHPLARVLTMQALRALTKAQYSSTNAGHFGLAFPVYCHFTSPIRRYPDLIVHRQVGRVLDGELGRARGETERIEAASVASSQAEREAIQAERAMLDLKKAEFMLAHLLEPGAGTVVSVTNFGLFVELDAYPIEGLVRADSILGEAYVFVERERALRGVRTGQRLRLGDRVEVEATNVSLQRREIDFVIIRRLQAEGSSARPRARKEPRAPRRQRKN